VRRFVSPIAAILTLAGCGDGAAPAIAPKAAAPAQVAAGYLAPPAVTSAGARDGRILLAGTAPANAKVRLATPQGDALFAQADAKGGWSLALPASTEARIFGLSAAAGPRTAQGEGYLLLTAAGEAVLLRAGAGAVRIGRQGLSGVDAVDFDREGGAVISGRAPANAPLSIHIDGDKTAEGRADAEGRYAIVLPQPIAGGRHQIDVFGDAAENSVTIDAGPAAPISNGPFRSAAVAGGLRVDWMTPGGGVQSTLLLE
jgi:hypothetical protein